VIRSTIEYEIDEAHPELDWLQLLRNMQAVLRSRRSLRAVPEISHSEQYQYINRNKLLIPRLCIFLAPSQIKLINHETRLFYHMNIAPN
jgi:tyrosine-protein phosphatase YwqE